MGDWGCCWKRRGGEMRQGMQGPCVWSHTGQCVQYLTEDSNPRCRRSSRVAKTYPYPIVPTPACRLRAVARPTVTSPGLRSQASPSWCLLPPLPLGLLLCLVSGHQC